MTAREFFYLVSQMREAQNEYFRERDQRTLRRARALEIEVDKEIARVKAIDLYPSPAMISQEPGSY